MVNRSFPAILEKNERSLEVQRCTGGKPFCHLADLRLPRGSCWGSTANAKWSHSLPFQSCIQTGCPSQTGSEVGLMQELPWDLLVFLMHVTAYSRYGRKLVYHLNSKGNRHLLGCLCWYNKSQHFWSNSLKKKMAKKSPKLSWGIESKPLSKLQNM